MVSGLQHKLAGFWLPTQVSGSLAYASQLVSGLQYKLAGFWPPTQVSGFLASHTSHSWFLAFHTNQWVSSLPYKSVGFLFLTQVIGFWSPTQVIEFVGFWSTTQFGGFLASHTSWWFVSIHTHHLTCELFPFVLYSFVEVTS